VIDSLLLSPTMLDTQTIKVLCALFYMKIHVSACQRFLSVMVRSRDALCPALFLCIVLRYHTVLLSCHIACKVFFPVALTHIVCSVVSWAVFPHNWAVFFIALREIFCCCGLRFFGLVFEKDFSIKEYSFCQIC